MSRFSTTWIQVYAHDESKEQKQVPAVGGVVLLSLSPHVHTHTNTHEHSQTTSVYSPISRCRTEQFPRVAINITIFGRERET